MTTIAYRNRQMSADTALSNPTMRFGTMQKIVRHDASGALAGAAGDAAECAAFLRDFKRYGLPSEVKPLWTVALFDSIGLITRKDGIIFIAQNNIIYPIEDEFYAIGSGDVFAIAAMKAGLGSIKAVKIASELDLHTGGQVRSLRHDKRTPCTE